MYAFTILSQLQYS